MGYQVVEVRKTEAQIKDEQKFKHHPRYYELLTAFRKDKFSLIEKSELDMF